MSLMVWLPLNGSLDNQGASNINVTNTNATVNTAGKIGSCYAFNGSNAKITIANLPNPENISIAMWFKRGATTNTRQFLFTAWKGITLELDTSNKITCSVYSNNKQTGYCNGPELTVESGWTHICFTFEKGVGTKLYINGTLYTSTALTTPIIWDTTSGDIGYYSTYLNGFVNDFRLYNHCLSAAEVHEISQGLVLHYKLDGGIFGNANLVYGSNTASTSTNSWHLSLQTGGVSRTVDYDNYTPIIVNTRDSTAHSGWQYLGYDNLNINAIKSSTTYTISFDVYSSADGTITIEGFKQGNASNNLTASNKNIMSQVIANKWNHIILQTTTKNSFDGLTVATQIVYMKVSESLRATGVVLKFKNMKVEEGEAATPWCAADTETNIDRTLIIDSSGYNNNGTVSTNPPTIISSQGRYSTAMSFNGTNNYIRAGRGGMVRDAVTVNIWGYKNPWDAAGRIVSCTESGGWNIESNGGYVEFGLGTGASSNTYKSVKSSILWTDLASGWHMFTGTYDGFSGKIYVDGILKGTYAAYTTKTPVYYHSSNGVFLGAEAGGTATTPAGTYWAGGIGDFRVYCTALSADDIKALYEIGAKVDNKGNIHCYEFQENNTSKITKQGIIQGKLFSEFGGMSYLKYDPNLYIEPDGSVWVHIFHHNNPASKLFNSTDAFTSSVYIDADRWFNVELCNYLDKWEIMFKGKYTSDGTEWKTRWIQQYNPMTATFANVAPANITKITTTGYTATESTVGGLYKRTYDSSYTYLCTNTGTESSWWGAVGSWTHYQSGIPGWFTGSKTVTTSGYNDMYIRIDNITITKPTIAKSTKNNIWLGSEFIET